jgi:hypothetical protein
MPLERELATFHAKLPELLATAAGKYVLIHGAEVAGAWDTKAQALEEGYRRFGLEPFLVKQLVAVEQPLFVPRGLV